jgi:hypothetical protein
VGTRPVALARILNEVGMGHLLAGRQGLWVGTRFAILGFSHRLSLERTWPARRDTLKETWPGRSARNRYASLVMVNRW